jgi:hypothetical protein
MDDACGAVDGMRFARETEALGETSELNPDHCGRKPMTTVSAIGVYYVVHVGSTLIV